MTPQTIAEIRASWLLCLSATGDLSDRFYRRLFNRAPGVRPLFKDDMERQKRKLIDTLATIVDMLDDPNALTAAAADLGRRHAGYGAQADHYPAVRASLLEALKQHLGDRHTPEIDAAWGRALDVLSDIMIRAGRQAGMRA